jgi:hypothetical protein
MPDWLSLLSLVLMVGLVAVIGASFGVGYPAIGGLFPQSGRRDWPVGIQESDTPHFAFHDAAPTLTPEMRRDASEPDTRSGIEELYDGPIRTGR